MSRQDKIRVIGLIVAAGIIIMGIYVCKVCGQEVIWTPEDTVVAPEIGERIIPNWNSNDCSLLLPNNTINIQKVPPIFSLQRLFSPWISPIGYSYGYENGKSRANFGAGVSYLMIRHIALTFEAHRDWGSKNSMFQISLKLH